MNFGKLILFALLIGTLLFVGQTDAFRLKKFGKRIERAGKRVFKAAEKTLPLAVGVKALG